jgi:hypothetical protein
LPFAVQQDCGAGFATGLQNRPSNAAHWRWPSAGIAAAPNLPNRNGELAWPALLRKLDRVDPSYRN